MDDKVEGICVACEEFADDDTDDRARAAVPIENTIKMTSEAYLIRE